MCKILTMDTVTQKEKDMLELIILNNFWFGKLLDCKRFNGEVRQLARDNNDNYLHEEDDADCELIEARHCMLQKYILDNNMITTVLDKACKETDKLYD